MSSISKVALAGATGNLGPAILEQLLNAGFKVTVLTRQGSTHSFPPSVTAVPVDYDSIDSLTSALEGQDAVVSTLASAAIATQLLLVEAAAKAQVKRFIPSEFGSNTLNEKVRALPLYKVKVDVQDALRKEASNGGMSHTVICTGPFLDWGIKVGFFINLKSKSIDLFDGGERPFSATTLPSIGKAVVGVLQHPEQTKNGAVYVKSAALTLKQLSAMGQEATVDKAGEWKENTVSTDELYQQGMAELTKDQPNPDVFVLNFIKCSIWAKGYGCPFEHTDNELLGIKEMSEAEVQELVNNLAH